MWHINQFTQELILRDSLTTRLLRKLAVSARVDLLCRHLGNNRIFIDIGRGGGGFGGFGNLILGIII